jgi:hypothetical protein
MHSSHHNERYQKEFLHGATVYRPSRVEIEKHGGTGTAADAAKLWATGIKDNMEIAYRIWRETGASQSDIEAYKENMLKQKFGL